MTTASTAIATAPILSLCYQLSPLY
jgi:hypothetical protein